MDKRIEELSRDPFVIDLRKGGGGWYIINSRTGDVSFRNAIFLASEGLVFSLVPGPSNHVLRLQYDDFAFDVGWTEDAIEAAKWVEEVNRFLATKKDTTATNGRIAPLAPIANSATEEKV